MLYQCKRCGFSTHIKTHYIRHLEARKKQCKVIYLDIPIETLLKEVDNKRVEIGVEGVKNGVEIVQNGVKGIFNNNISAVEVNNSNIKCPKCGKEFKSKKYLTQHINRYGCKEKLKQEETELVKQIRAEKDAEMAQKDEENQLLKKQIEVLMTKIGNTNCNNTTNNTNNTNIETQNNTTIQINGWGHEDTSHLTDKFLRFCYDRPFTSIQRVIEAVYFNPNCPKNWNTMIKDDKSSKALIYNAEKKTWLKTETNGVVDELMHKGYGILDANFDQQKDANKLTDRIIEKFTSFQDFYAKGDKHYEKRLATEIKELLINYKAYHVLPDNDN